MTDWKIKENNGNFSDMLLEKYGPIILQLLKNRGLETSEEIEKYFNFDYEKDLSDPFKITDMEKAVERISKAASDSSRQGSL